jgi:hypothetical protein
MSGQRGQIYLEEMGVDLGWNVHGVCMLAIPFENKSVPFLLGY